MSWAHLLKAEMYKSKTTEELERQLNMGCGSEKNEDK